MAINPLLLLYIEPKNPPSKTPNTDELWAGMVLALKSAKAGCANYTATTPKDIKFHEGLGYRGWHQCSCGAHSSNKDYLLKNGEITNSLAPHYLEFHRDEIPPEQIERVKKVVGL